MKKSAFTLINLYTFKSHNNNFVRRNQSSGFTLIELLVVIVIIGILATISVAQFNNYQEKARTARAQAFASQTDKIFQLHLEPNDWLGNWVMRHPNATDTNKLVDLTPNHNNLTITGAHTLINDSPFGDTQQSLQLSVPSASASALFRNAESFSNKSHLASNSKDELTISFWFKVDDIAGSNPKLLNFTDTSRPAITINNDSDSIRFTLKDTDNTSLLANKKIKSDTWHHVLAMYGNGAARLYFDGVKQSHETGLTGLYDIGSSHLHIAAQWGGITDYNNLTFYKIKILKSVIDLSSF